MLLTTNELAQRWGMSADYLKHMRSNGQGPAYIRLGHRTVRYALDTILRYEHQRMTSP